VDTAHFARARQPQSDPEDQAGIPQPRIGFFGVLDERLDCELIDAVAQRRPDWHVVLIGPTVKIDPACLPRRDNIHYLGAKAYADLPRYLAGWDAALLPFARNEATRFISPTKTPEYLAAGRAVVSTSIRDVVQPYGSAGLVRIADAPDDFVTAVAGALADDRALHVARCDRFLSDMSWDGTWAAMAALVDAVVAAEQPVAA
jgi:UDP-galactopyranose mutase